MKRRILGMPVWLYVVVALLVVGLIASMPAVGTFLGTVALIAAAIVGVVGSRASRNSRPDPRSISVFAPVPITGSVELPLAKQQEVVGESHYHSGIDFMVKQFGVQMKAVLLAEVDNPYDRNAVRVDLFSGDVSRQCGYLPADVSASYSQMVRENASRGIASVLDAQIFGGTSDKPNYGVWIGQARARRGMSDPIAVANSTGWPQLGSQHANGDRVFGRFTGSVQQHRDAGTPFANKLYPGTISALVAGVTIDDDLGVEFDGEKYWWAMLGADRVGRLTWRQSDGYPYPAKGRLRIMRVTMDQSGAIVNCGGIVYPEQPSR